jgi:NAD(P)-dependent dehydrogenase (short-subunit alcohol dehydrogenase family)
MSTVPSIVDGVSLTGEHAVVTGGSSGIGRCTARTLASAGAAVSVLDVRERPDGGGEPTATTVRDAGGEAAFVEADVTRADDVESAVEEAESRFGPVSLLVNNAGVNHLGRVDEVGLDEWDRTLAVNLRGAFLTTRRCIDSLVATEGAIVNVASGAGLHGSPRYAAYGPSKAALINFTKQVAVDFSPEGVRVNAVAPGTVETRRVVRKLADPELAAMKRENTLLTRLGDVQDVANAVAYLASDAASFVTGETLVVDGGWDA